MEIEKIDIVYEQIALTFGVSATQNDYLVTIKAIKLNPTGISRAKSAFCTKSNTRS